MEGGVKTILKWKATEYRLFVLYIGIVLFRCRKIVNAKLKILLQFSEICLSHETLKHQETRT